MFERFNRIFAGGLKGGIDTEDNTNDKGNKEGDDEDLPANVGGERSDDRNEEGEEIAEDDTEDAAHDGEEEGFKYKLHEDVAAGGADGFPDADFVGALGDRDQHNVHNADTADDERNTSNEGKHTGNHVQHGARGVSDLIAVSHGEIGVTGVVLDQGGFDGAGGGRKVADSGGHNVDLLDLRSAEEFTRDLNIHKESFIKIDIVEVDVLVELLEDTNDDEALTAKSESLTHRISSVKEEEGKFVTDDDGVIFILITEEGAGL